MPKILQLNSQTAREPVDKGKIPGDLIHFQNRPVAELMLMEMGNIFLANFLRGAGKLGGIMQHGPFCLADLGRSREVRIQVFH